MAVLELPLWYRYDRFRQRAADLVLALIQENEILRAQLAELRPIENPWPLLSGEDIIRELHPEDQTKIPRCS